jgi:hypothetical protein
MTTSLCATPYDTSAPFFYFDSLEEFQDNFAAQLPVEEYEIQYIDGDNPRLFKDADITQANVSTWFEFLQDIDDDSDQGIALRWLLSMGYSLDEALTRTDDVTIHHGSAKDYAMEITDISGIPAHIAGYIDYEAIARDLEIGGDITEFCFDIYLTNSNCF